MKVISFYTKNTIYEKEVQDLVESCQSLQIDHYIEEREDLGAWEKNTNQKALFILECLKRFQEPLLWVDADGIVLKKPNLSLSCDLGLYFNDFEKKHVRNATIYVEPTKNTEEFLLFWYEKQRVQNAKSKGIAKHDQTIMNEILKDAKLEIGQLPLEYMQIFDRDLLSLEQTVILHFQASRTARMAPEFWQNLTGKELKAMRMAVSAKKKR